MYRLIVNRQRLAACVPTIFCIVLCEVKDDSALYCFVFTLANLLRTSRHILASILVAYNCWGKDNNLCLTQPVNEDVQ